MQTSLILTKLNIPPIQRELVPRQHLFQRLNQGLESKLMLVSAPAGYGKTMLLSAWAGQCRIPVTWISLDEGDNDPVRFLAYLIAAIDKIMPGFGERIEPAGAVQDIQPHDQLLSIVVNEITRAGQPFVLVLDDYHLIQQQPVHKIMLHLLAHLPPEVHLVIASRADPPLQLARLRARSQLTELRLVDLCFTLDEVILFLNQVMKLNLSDPQSAALFSRTEGWIAGLQIAAISLRATVEINNRIQSFSGSNRFILDYLGEEVLASQPEEIQFFLMQTSILDRLNGQLCDAVTDKRNSQEMLERLERDNLFIIPLDQDRSWYRYHQLFLDLLRKRALQHLGGDLVDLHRKASLWFEKANDSEGAIQHALAAKDLERAAVLIEAAAQPFLLRSQLYTFEQWINRLPQDILQAHPNLILFFTWVLALSGTPASEVEQKLNWLDQKCPQRRGSHNVIRSYLMFVQGEFLPAVQLLHRSLEDIPTEDELFYSIARYLLSISDVMSGRFSSGSQMLEAVVQNGLEKGQVLLAAGALCNLAEVHARLGQLQAARDDYERVLTITQDAHGQHLPIASKALIGLAEIYREWNNLEQAEAFCTEGMSLVPYLREAVAMTGYIIHARILQARRDVQGAQAAIQKALECAYRTSGTNIDDLYVYLYRALLNFRQGDLAAVERWIIDRGISADIDPADLDQQTNFYKYHLLKYELLVLVRWLAATGDHDRAIYSLNILQLKMKEQGRIQLLIETLLLRALTYGKQGMMDRALNDINDCLSLAEPGGYMRIFLDEGPAIEPLLRLAESIGSNVDYANRILAALEDEISIVAGENRKLPGIQTQTPGLVEPLTGREIELLRLIAAGLSNQQIAQSLFISLPTVKWHISNILSKLDVRSRTQAVAQARVRGLIDAD